MVHVELDVLLAVRPALVRGAMRVVGTAAVVVIAAFLGRVEVLGDTEGVLERNVQRHLRNLHIFREREPEGLQVRQELRHVLHMVRSEPVQHGVAIVEGFHLDEAKVRARVDGSFCLPTGLAN